MKKRIIALPIPLLLIFCLLLCGCEPSRPIFPEETEQTESESIYAEELQRLETLLSELTKTQTGNQKEHQEKIERLEQEIKVLREQLAASTETESSNADTDTDSETAPSLSSSEFLYIRRGSNAILTGYTGDGEFLVLPSSIDGYTLTEIADNAFESSTLRSIVIPNTVTKIGWFAFQACTALQSVTVPETVVTIGYAAFPSGLSSFTLYCTAGSFAQRYAESYGISYALI